MRILIIRHGDPDYAKDSLTEKGWREAELLADKIAKLDIKAFYVSPLGRAQDTANVTLKKMGREAVTCKWLREFNGTAMMHGLPRSPWDLMPSFYTKDDNLYNVNAWHNTSVMKHGTVWRKFQKVTSSFDELLALHGYERSGKCYKAVSANTDTIALFCHFGVECVLLSHLLNISPVSLWQGFCAAPTSVTSLYTEERKKGIAIFRCNAFGDISHLYAAGEEPAFAARFCETYDDTSQRH